MEPKLIPVESHRPLRDDETPVIALVHNEANLLPAFLDHYRSICTPRFMIVDDRSTDGSRDLLRAAADVDLYEPVDGSSYAQDKALWRQEILDARCAGRWVLLPDVDELFVWLGMEAGLNRLCAALDDEGAEAVFTLMIDMYADAALADQVYKGDRPLTEAFRWLDGFQSYTIRRKSKRMLTERPTPPVTAYGGMRHRLFHSDPTKAPWWQRALIWRFEGVDAPLDPPRGGVRWVVSKLTKSRWRRALVMNKIGLVKWRTGARFAKGPHELRDPFPISAGVAGVLHFPFTRGAEGVAYIAQRGQHADGARHYRDLDLEKSPRSDISLRYRGVESLSQHLRPFPGL
ncbi:MAG: hypothetical protein CSA72_00745 [Rhodobacterales bacterium]|nr:MAG: hypothetical protein CSA72_00745 [Rhodobacterales bacterium]